MALKKSELCSSLWQGCAALRGGMDASRYKDDVLVTGKEMVDRLNDMMRALLTRRIHLMHPASSAIPVPA